MEETTESTEEVESTTEGTQPEGQEIRDPKAVLEALSRAKDDAKKYREQFEQMEKANTELADRIAALEGDEGIALWKGKAIALAAKAELAKSGVADPSRVYGFMDTEGIDLDADGGLTGFAESLAAVKKKLPELFDNKKRVGGTGDGFAKGDVKPSMSTTEMQLERLKHKN